MLPGRRALAATSAPSSSVPDTEEGRRKADVSEAKCQILGLIAARDSAPNFPIHLVAKDLNYLNHRAEQLDAALPIIEATRSVFEHAAAGNERDLDIAGIAKVYQR